MSYKIIWQPNSEMTYYEEADFILRKWNGKEVYKFQSLVFDNIDRIIENPYIGKFEILLKIYMIVISKQTTLYYNINEKDRIINLLLFWNNSKNPADLTKLL